MWLVEDQHRAQTNSTLAGSTNVDTDSLGLLQERITLWGVEGNEGTASLASQVLELVGVLLCQALDAGIEVVTYLGGVLDKVQALDLLDDAAEEDGAGWVAHPGVELTVWLVGAQLGVAVVVAGRLGLLGEGHHVRWGREVPVLVSPELAGCADTGLHLVDDEQDVVLLGKLAETAEEGWGRVVVATLGLDGLDDDGCWRVVVGSDETLDVGEGIGLGLCILGGVLLKWVLELRKDGLWPVESWDIKLVDRLGAGSGKGAEETAVEGGLEGENGVRRGTWSLVVHGRRELLGSELDIWSTTALLSLPHESGLVCGLVGVGTGHGSEDLVKSLWRNSQETGLENVCPIR